MKFRGYMLLAAGLVFGGALFSQALRENSSAARPPDETPKEKTPVDFRADRMYGDQELLRSVGIDERAQILVGNVAFHHNGAIIACDSAVRYYSANRLDCFGNVIINKDSIFVYGDRAEYNGDHNMASVFSPVVKVIDGDATLYTTRVFSFNTADNIGTWTDGGVVYQADNVMESERGYFYSDLHEMVGVRGVQMKNDSHQLISDSVRYNTETKVATFYTRTYIWTAQGEMISALQGRYNTQDSTYFFRDNAYILDEFRETWADTVEYNARSRNAVFYGNVQIDDNEHSSSAFGDLAHYWGERGETRLTRRPALLNYDADQGNTDTLYMRADTVYMYVRYPSDSRRRDSLGRPTGEDVDNFEHLKWVDSLSDSVRLNLADSLVGVIAGLRERIASMNSHADSILRTLYPEPEPAAEPAFEAMPSVPTITVAEPADVGLEPAGDSLTVADILTLPDYSLLATDTLPAPDSLSEPEIAPARETISPSQETISPPPAPDPEKIEPPEVVELRMRMAELAAEADSLTTAENYIRPRMESAAPDNRVADSLARLRLDSISRIDSLVRIDSIRLADPKAYRVLQKAAAKRAKAEKQRLAAERREAKYAEKALARTEKERLRVERRAKIAAEKASKINARRRTARREDVLLDSLARADSLLLRDSIGRLDSMLRLDSLMLLDSLTMRDTVTTTADTTFRIFRGWYNVKIWRKDMQAVCDSIVGFSLDSTLHMYKDPIIWHADSQVTADSTVLYTKAQQIEHAEFFGNPIMGNQIGGAGSRQFNQVKGRHMASWFRDGNIYRHDTKENAQTLYYMQEEEQGEDGSTVMSEALGFLVGTAAEISFMFRDDSLRYIVMRNVVDYTVFPMDQIPNTQPTLLQGFVWSIDRQPLLADVFDRRVRPTERAYHENLPRPDFPIAARIERRREYLISNRMWADRVDPLPAYAVEFRRVKYQPPSDQQAQ